MQRKPILIIAAIAVLGICVFLFVRSKYLVKPGQTEVIAFLEKFNTDVNAGDADVVLKYFDTHQKASQITGLLKLLCNKTGSDGKEAPLFYVSLAPDQSDIKIINPEIVEARVPGQFTEKVNSGNVKQTSLWLKLRKVSPGVFKIIRVDAQGFYKDYVAYESYVRPIDNTITYSPETIEAFKTAEQLKTKYDSVVWFAHVDQKTYYYVVKGKWDMAKDIERYKDSIIEPYGMGLVNPELKEIIPPQYDLIHNISATFPGLVEVEKSGKKGFYDLDGKNVLPVVYEQILPINDAENLAVLRTGADYYYLKKDYSVSDKIMINIADYLSKIKDLNTPFDLNKKALAVVTEYNSKANNGAVYIPPSFLTDLNITSKFVDFKNPLRKGGEGYEEVHTKYEVKTAERPKETGNWFTTAFYSIRDYFLGGRAEFYDRKYMVMADKKTNRLYTADIGVDYSPEGSGSLDDKTCDINSVRMLGDSLIEVKAGAVLYVQLYDSTKDVVAGPYYHYLKIKDNKLVELPGSRNFGFTQYVKMDDSYLEGCYQIQPGAYQGNVYKRSKIKTIDHITPEMLRYMKNEIYASYRYKFKDKRWQEVFLDMVSKYEDGGKEMPPNANVDDSLTVIDKYNINFINQKLNGVKSSPKVLAAK